jgi:hypothetical protein
MADKVADLSARIIPHPTISDLSTNDIKTSIKHKIFFKWQNYWDTIPPLIKLKQLKKIQRNGSHLITSTDNRKLQSRDA